MIAQFLRRNITQRPIPPHLVDINDKEEKVSNTPIFGLFLDQSPIQEQIQGPIMGVPSPSAVTEIVNAKSE
jgi:hypothetical protein